MNTERLSNLLNEVKSGKTSIESALDVLKGLPYESTGFAMIDHHRSMRKGYAEVIFCEGKTINQIKEIAVKLSAKSSSVLATRANMEVYEAVKSVLPNSVYNESARIILIGEKIKPLTDKKILVITAGTADIPVAEEAAFTAEVIGNNVERLFDAGVAGIHRLFDNIDKINSASVIIAVAGMDGALPSVVGGISPCPVIAVPTSVGYGASFSGVAPLLTMLNSCAPGVVVVNIDNGFGAGYAASMICRENPK